MDKGMKIGTLIAMGIVAVVGIVFILRLREPPDEPTKATSAANLKRVDLPSGLPALWVSDKPDRSAAASYGKAVEFVVQHYPDSNKEPSDKVLGEVSALLIEGMEAGQVTQGLFDDLVPLKPQPHTPQMKAIPMVAVLGAKQAIKNAERSEHDRAVKELLAVWAYGQRLMESSNRFHCRFFGLQAVTMARLELEQEDLMSRIPEGEKKLAAWRQAIPPVQSAWSDKVKLIWTVKPHPGDLINLARREEDPVIRADAIRYLGVLKYLTKKKGNLQAIDDVLAAAKADTNPLFAQAAAAAEGLTQQEFRKLR